MELIPRSKRRHRLDILRKPPLRAPSSLLLCSARDTASQCRRQSAFQFRENANTLSFYNLQQVMIWPFPLRVQSFAKESNRNARGRSERTSKRAFGPTLEAGLRTNSGGRGCCCRL